MKPMKRTIQQALRKQPKTTRDPEPGKKPVKAAASKPKTEATKASKPADKPQE